MGQSDSASSKGAVSVTAFFSWIKKALTRLVWGKQYESWKREFWGQ